MSRLTAFITFSIGWLIYHGIDGGVSVDSFEGVYAAGVALSIHWIYSK